MAKLTKTQREELRLVLRRAEQAKAYLMRDHIVIACKDAQATTSLHYTCPSKEGALYPVNKEIGSDLTGLYDAIDFLAKFLVRN